MIRIPSLFRQMILFDFQALYTQAVRTLLPHPGLPKHHTTILCFALLCPGYVMAQISPGPLSKAHSALSGPTHCVDCHDPGKSPPEFKCLDCHRDIRERLTGRRGLHPSLVGADTSSRVCVHCHSEHNGLEFAIIHWDRPVNSFDHRRAGYALEGKHARLPCRECHKAARISLQVRDGISTKDLNRTYLGLSPKCAGCHDDEHRGQLTGDCGNCHDSLSWKTAARFDHARSRFQLAGAHQKVLCEKCHSRVQDAKPYVKYKGIPFEDCTPCHKDQHKGSFRASCRSCHSMTSWKVTRGTVLDVFNHATTRYPLEGKHINLSCELCHLRGDFKEPVPHARCSDCHKKDPHRGQFASRADGGDCSICHSVEGFKPAKFGISEHKATRFALGGRHAETACAKCHPPAPEGATYRFEDVTCIRCHKDIHAGQFQGAPHLNRCEDCHTDHSFKPSRFTVASHAKTRFPLAGAHAAVICAECHRKSETGGSAGRFRFDETSCTACHNDPHEGQFAERMKTSLPDGNVAGCTACHNTQTWREVKGFDHAATGFVLEGAHRAVPCEGCHKSNNLTTGTRNVIFKSTPKQCYACHDDIHGGQFAAGSGETNCALCHKVLKWKPSNFNHDTQSNYKLDGAHRNVRCTLCHSSKREVEGKLVLFYKPTTRECAACHGSGIEGKKP